VKNLGGGLVVVVFASGSASLGYAIAMKQGVEQNERGVGRRATLVSASAWARSVGGGVDYFGDPVVQAAGLCARGCRNARRRASFDPRRRCGWDTCPPQALPLQNRSSFAR
jgi:hypothetical protein